MIKPPETSFSTLGLGEEYKTYNELGIESSVEIDFIILSPSPLLPSLFLL